MIFLGRWVPMQVMDMIFLLWTIGAVVLTGFVLYSYVTRNARAQQGRQEKRKSKKRTKR